MPLGAGTKTVYVKVVDAVGNEKVFTDSLALGEDMWAPNVEVAVNGGAAATTNPAVDLGIEVTDNVSVEGEMQMSFSNNRQDWSPWEVFTPTKSWDITDPAYGGSDSEGIKTVYVRVTDKALNMAYGQAQIGFGRSIPTGSIAITGGAEGTYKGEPCLFANSDSPVAELNFPSAAQVRYDFGSGWEEWKSYSSSEQLFLPKYQGLCRIRVQVKDVNGIPSDPVSKIVLIDPEAPKIDYVKVQGDITATNSGAITLIVSAHDNRPDGMEIRYSINGGEPTVWEAFSDTLTANNLQSGYNDIKVEVRDASGNISSKHIGVWRL